MIYLDNGATSLNKPAEVYRAVNWAMGQCANPGRGGYPAAMKAAEMVYSCREEAAMLFDCRPEQVVFTANCTHGLNIAIRTLIKPGGKVVISGFEHNAVTRPLHVLQAKVKVAGRKLFDWKDTLDDFEADLRSGADCAVFTHVSNVFGYILPVEEMAALCRYYRVPFIIDAAQSAGILPVHLQDLGANFVAMPGHKGLLGPQGTGILLCGSNPEPLLCGGTGSESTLQDMPDFLPDRVEAGTLNVPGIAGLREGLRYLRRKGLRNVFQKEHAAAMDCAARMKKMGFHVFAGEHQAGTVSFLPSMDCEETAQLLAQRGFAVRAGLHCAPLAHESAGTLDTGTVRISFGQNASPMQSESICRALAAITKR